jgi:hypothetical protein
MPFRVAYAQVARQLQEGSFKPVRVADSNTVPKAAQLALTELAITLADIKTWIGNRRRFLASATQRLFDWP